MYDKLEPEMGQQHNEPAGRIKRVILPVLFFLYTFLLLMLSFMNAEKYLQYC